MSGTSCIIPFYNEGERVIRVVDQIEEVAAITETICVDDGSTDSAGRALRARHPSIEVLRHDRNRGKTEAVRTGLARATGSYTLLLDADLRRVDAERIQATITRVYRQSPPPAMVIFRKKTASLLARFDRRDLVLSGDRLVRTRELNEALGPSVSGFQLEVAVNEYMMRHEREVRWISWRAENTRKIEKYSLVRGIVREVTMLRNVIEHVGVTGFARQLLFLGRRELPLEGC